MKINKHTYIGLIVFSKFCQIRVTQCFSAMSRDPNKSFQDLEDSLILACF